MSARFKCACPILGSVFVYLLCHGFALTVTRKKREQRRRAKGNEQGERGAEKLAKQQAAMVTMMRKKKKFVGNGNGFTWSQLPGFSLSHSHTPIPLPSFSLYLRLFVHVSVACCAFCVSLCAAQLLTVSAFATTMRHAKMSRSLTRQAQFINGTSSPFSLSPLPRCLWLKTRKKYSVLCLSNCPTDVASIASLSLSFSFPFSFSTRVVAVCLLLWQQFIK